MKLSRLKVVLVLSLLIVSMPPASVNAQVSGGVNVFTIVPKLVCVGDSFKLDGVASTDWQDFPEDIPLAPLQITTVQISALHGKVTPEFNFPK